MSSLQLLCVLLNCSDPRLLCSLVSKVHIQLYPPSYLLLYNQGDLYIQPYIPAQVAANFPSSHVGTYMYLTKVNTILEFQKSLCNFLWIFRQSEIQVCHYGYFSFQICVMYTQPKRVRKLDTRGAHHIARGNHICKFKWIFIFLI